MKRPMMAFALSVVMLFPAGFSLAADPAGVQQGGVQPQKQERIYGSQLMTPQERAEYRARMRVVKTAEEREELRKEHHERMKERAAARGVTLPDEPPARGGGLGLGRGRGR